MGGLRENGLPLGRFRRSGRLLPACTNAVILTAFCSSPIRRPRLSGEGVCDAEFHLGSSIRRIQCQLNRSVHRCAQINAPPRSGPNDLSSLLQTTWVLNEKYLRRIFDVNDTNQIVEISKFMRNFPFCSCNLDYCTATFGCLYLKLSFHNSIVFK